jgi:hypothetical protein
VTNEVLNRVKEAKNILHIIKKRKARWMVKSCVRTVFQNILLKARHKYTIEGKTQGRIEVIGR